jgi:membrane-bound lytic murein transglycosylase A
LVVARSTCAKAIVCGIVTSFIGAAASLNTAAQAAENNEPLTLAGSQLEPVNWPDLTGWPGDDHVAAFAAFAASCRVVRNAGQSDEHARVQGALSNVCRKSLAVHPQNSQAARAFFEDNFLPVRLAPVGETSGLLTGYFEPIVQGSRFPTPEFHVPVYRRPHDLLVAGHKPGSNAFPNKGAQIGRRNEKGQFVPYYDRAAIEAGALDDQKLEICWLKDPFDLLTIQIEGSGRVILEDGTPLRINYDSHNGYSFTSLSNALMRIKRIPAQEKSAPWMHDWMTQHPDEAEKLRTSNRSYVFFRVSGLSKEGEPVGAQGVPLSPGRSIAVDRLHPYGMPFFIEASLPVENAKAPSQFSRLMIAQDTGSAIVGPARADLYWGSGDEAARVAGRIHHPGRFVMLLPRELDMIEAGRHMPLPLPKPKPPEVEIAQRNGKGSPASTKTEIGPPAVKRAERRTTYARWRYRMWY